MALSLIRLTPKYEAQFGISPKIQGICIYMRLKELSHKAISSFNIKGAASKGLLEGGAQQPAQWRKLLYGKASCSASNCITHLSLTGTCGAIVLRITGLENKGSHGSGVKSTNTQTGASQVITLHFQRWGLRTSCGGSNKQ